MNRPEDEICIEAIFNTIHFLSDQVQHLDESKRVSYMLNILLGSYLNLAGQVIPAEHLREVVQLGFDYTMRMCDVFEAEHKSAKE